MRPHSTEFTGNHAPRPFPSLSAATAKAKKNFVEKLREMIKKDGVRSFYKGLGMALIATVASFGSYFFFYRLLKNVVTHTFSMKES